MTAILKKVYTDKLPQIVKKTKTIRFKEQRKHILKYRNIH